MKEKENLVKPDTYLNDGSNIFFHVREREEGNEYLKKYSHVENTSTGIVTKQIIGLGLLKKNPSSYKDTQETNIRRSLVKKIRLHF